MPWRLPPPGRGLSGAPHRSPNPTLTVEPDLAGHSRVLQRESRQPLAKRETTCYAGTKIEVTAKALSSRKRKVAQVEGSVIMWGTTTKLAFLSLVLLGVPRPASAQLEPDLSEVVHWVLPPSRACVVAACPKFIPTAEGEAGTVEQGVMFETELPFPGELLLPARGEFRVVRRVGRLEETFLFYGPASIFLHADGSYEFISPGAGKTGEETASHSSLPHGLPPLIAGVEGTQFDYVITPEGMVFLHVLTGLVTARWWQDGWEQLTIRGGEAILLDSHDYGGGRVLRNCSEEGGAACGRTTVRHLYGDAAAARWRTLKGMLDARGTRTSDAYQAMKAFEAMADRVERVTELDIQMVGALFAAYTDMLVPCTPKQVVRAAERLADLLPGHVASVHAYYLAWLKARVRGQTELADSMYVHLVASKTGGPWEGLVSLPEIIDSPIQSPEGPETGHGFDWEHVIMDPNLAPPVSR